MFKPKLNFKKLSIPQKIQRAREIVAKLTGNANFPNPVPALAAITAAINALEAAHEAAADGGHTLKAAMHVKEKTLNDLVVQIEDHVSNISAGDEQKILSAGMEIKNIAIRGKFSNKVSAGKNTGEVILTAAGETGINPVSHEWQHCPDPLPPAAQKLTDNGNSWSQSEISTTASYTFTGLTPGIKMWFRHRAILTKSKKTPWTVIGSVVAPF
jgi:hypothetical protein